MQTINIALFSVIGTAKREIFSQEMTVEKIEQQMNNGLKDLKKLISFYILNKTGDYRLEIGENAFNFVGNRFASSLSQVLHMVAAAQLAEVGRGAEMTTIGEVASQMEQTVAINPELLTTLHLAERVLDGNVIALGQLSKNFKIEFKDESEED